MTPHEFIRKWKPVELTERAAAQEHFIDLCRLVGHPTPAEADPTGEEYCFEKGALKSSGNPGFADVWKRGHFAFEYKKKKKNLGEALKQLSQYAWNLESPPLNVACDTNTIRIVTAFNNTPSRTFEIKLDQLADPEHFAILHAVFHEPNKLRAAMTRAQLTREAADKFSGLSMRLQSRGHAPEIVAHFIMQLVFCFFAEDVRLLPEGFFRKALKQLQIGNNWRHAKAMLDDVFNAMASGGRVGLDFIAHFNGGLFDGQKALPLDQDDVALLVAAGSMQWAEIDPSIFGTLFERFLDPAKRKQIGAHYTDEGKIRQIVDPVVMAPLEAEWIEARAEIEKFAKRGTAPGLKKAAELQLQFIERLANLRILDPACGSGNFLYVALQRVKDLEFRVINECEQMGLKARAPKVGPEILHGLEINGLAAELARATIWIGDIQWGLKHAIFTRPEPILRKLEAIENRDALLNADGSEAQWPACDFMVGNPPFLGGKKLRAEMGDDVVEAVFAAYAGKVPPEADLVCYWFAKAWEAVQAGRAGRVGLVATNSIRGGANRRVLEPIAEAGAIFEAWSDEPWIVDGAAVRVSMVCFGAREGATPPPCGEGQGRGSRDLAEDSATPHPNPPPQGGGESQPRLDGRPVARIHADLSARGFDITRAKRLRENEGRCFQGPVKVGSFDIDGALAREWLAEPANPNGRSNSEVLRPWCNGSDLVRRPTGKWIVDFDEMSEADASFFQSPFEYVKAKIKPVRDANRDSQRRTRWWLLGRSGSDLRQAMTPLTRCILTPRVAKHRLFVWQTQKVLPDSAVVAIARDDDTAFGILHSRFHEAWALRLGTSLEDRPRYTPTTTFETFPFPEGLTPDIPAAAYADDPRAQRIADAAKKLDELRRAWLNPPDLVAVVPEVVPGYPDRILPKNAEAAAKLKERTLTALYNQRPQWLADAHAALDRAVAAAYGWPEDISTEEALAKLLALNLARAARDGATS